VLERFIVDSSRLVTALAERRDDLAGVIGNLNQTTRALGNQKGALAESIERLPPFMRRANTTFVNLRAALDDVDPLVDAAKPVAARLDPFLDQARGFAADAEPTVRDLRVTVRRRGRDNDLINYIDTVPRLTDIAIETKPRNGAQRAGAFPQSADAFRKAAPIISEARPYTTDLLGWFDDFSTTGGGFDALGAYARAFIGLSETLTGPAKRNQFKRCPGAAELPARDGSNVLSAAEMQRLDCQESARAPGDVP
jgi:phospholipid/cholesterol/gamma-HCH transport system substrate-binding protein